MKRNYVFESTGNKVGQIAILGLSGIFFIVFLIFLIFKFTIYMLLLTIIACVFFILINLYSKKFYDIKIGNGVIIFNNLWEKGTYPIESLKEVNQLPLFYPTLMNKFLEFTLNNGKKVATKMPNYLKIYFSKGGISLYLENLRNSVFSLARPDTVQ